MNNMRFGIDVSENNGHLALEQWQKIKDWGVDFAIIRSSYGRHGVDSEFANNVLNATKVGIECGAYHYGYALNEEQAKEETINCKNIIEATGCLLTLPVFYDFEDADEYKKQRGYDITAEENTIFNTNLIKAFFTSLPYNTGLYASYWLATNRINDLWNNQNKKLWLAAWSESPQNWDIWQFTDHIYIKEAGVFDGNVMR